MKLILLLNLALTVFFAPQSWAAGHYEGYLSVVNGRVYLNTIDDQTRRELTSLNPVIKKDLQRLKSGDFVSITGTKYFNLAKIRVDVINFVGLQSLLGTWQDGTKLVFNFSDFKSLSLYWPSEKENAFDYHYSVIPGEGEGWNIFIVNKDSISLGKILLGEGNKTAQLQVINTETGDTEEIFDLHRVR